MIFLRVFDLEFFGKDKYVLSLSSLGSVSVQRPQNFIQSGNLTDFVQVSSYFVGDVVEKQVETWIIVVSAVAGILLLLLVILGLVKVYCANRYKECFLNIVFLGWIF